MQKQFQTIKKADEFADLSAYSLRQRILIRLADFAFYFLIVAIGVTLRYETRNWQRLEEIERAGQVPIYAFWHNQIFLAAYFFRGSGAVVMTSRSFDGEYIARAIQRLGFGAARGSSTRGGVGALIEMARFIRAKRAAAFTVDGPRGPLYVAKNGALLLSKKTAQPVVPICFTAEKFWAVKSWDKLRIPRPFSRSLVALGEPFSIEETAEEAALEQYRQRLQAALEQLAEEGEEWRAKK
ncbi:MAG: lysophospholipid acyltransferase family protein [Acidobacteriota bacterium]|nr:lysophospholipid acyltransferase family protein [Acidobacteriota bacterium]